MSIRCRFGLHDFRWPVHSRPFSLWDTIRVECARGCGARTTRICDRDNHWSERHPDPSEERTDG